MSLENKGFVESFHRGVNNGTFPASDGRTPHTERANSIMAPSVAEQNLIVKVGDERLSLTYDTIRRGRKLKRRGWTPGGGGDALRGSADECGKNRFRTWF